MSTDIPETEALQSEKSRSWMQPFALALGLAGLLVGGVLGFAVGSSGEDGGSDSSVEAAQARAEERREAAAAAVEQQRAEEEAAAEAEAEALAAQSAAVPPEPSEFTLGITVLEQQCFGTAGCVVTYRIEPMYNGTRDATDLELTYEVTGGEAKSINSFEIDSAGTARFDSEETARTASEDAVLTATVTSVRRAP